jgi:hypothetical protein
MSVQMNVVVKPDRAKANKIALAESKRRAGHIAVTALAYATATAPYEFGTLANSGSLVETAEGYGVIFSAPHAVFVHEMPQSSIKNGKKARFLAAAFEEALAASGVEASTGGQEL